MQLGYALGRDLDNLDPLFREFSCKLVPLDPACDTCSKAVNTLLYFHSFRNKKLKIKIQKVVKLQILRSLKEIL